MNSCARDSISVGARVQFTRIDEHNMDADETRTLFPQYQLTSRTVRMELVHPAAGTQFGTAARTAASLRRPASVRAPQQRPDGRLVAPHRGLDQCAPAERAWPRLSCRVSHFSEFVRLVESRRESVCL